jgi:hypothetical protein
LGRGAGGGGVVVGAFADDGEGFADLAGVEGDLEGVGGAGVDGDAADVGGGEAGFEDADDEDAVGQWGEVEFTDIVGEGGFLAGAALEEEEDAGLGDGGSAGVADDALDAAVGGEGRGAEGGQGEEEREGGGGRGEFEARAGGAAVGVGGEHRAEAVLEIGHTCHGEDSFRYAFAVGEVAYDLHEVCGVVRRAFAELEDAVVAGQFGFETKTGGGGPDPGQRPVESGGESGEGVDEGVAAEDVGGLVAEDGAELGRGPVLRGFREDDDGPGEAADEGHGGVGGEEDGGAIEAAPGLGAAREAVGAEVADGEAEKEEGGAGGPEGEEPVGPGGRAGVGGDGEDGAGGGGQFGEGQSGAGWPGGGPGEGGRQEEEGAEAGGPDSVTGGGGRAAAEPGGEGRQGGEDGAFPGEGEEEGGHVSVLPDGLFR